jgi:hypothetical protein
MRPLSAFAAAYKEFRDLAEKQETWAMQIATSRLDPASLAYLQQIGKTAGVGANGVFVPKRFRMPDPRAGWVCRFLFGAAALGIALYLCMPSDLDGTNLGVRAYWQAGLAAVGCLLLLLALRRRMRPVSEPLLPAFAYADARNYWDVNGERVVSTNLETLNDVDAYHTTTQSGTYVSSRIVLKYREHNEQLYLDHRERAEELTRFMSWLVALRKSDNYDLREMAGGSPATLGALARRLTDVGPEGDLANLTVGPELPSPSENSALPQRSRIDGRAALPWLAAAAVLAVGIVGFPMLDSYLLDGYLFAKVQASSGNDVKAIEYYLARFPAGLHATEAHNLRDDRLFATAVQEADERSSPSSLRRYLSDASNNRHRDEAQRRINLYYDKAIAVLKERAKTDGAKMDQQMFDAVLALLEALKHADRPVATVGFKATQDPLPVTEEQKLFEELLTKKYIEDKPELAGIAKLSPDNSAILPPGRVFDPVETKNRERVILDRLRSAVKKVLASDILSLEPAEAGTTPTIEVAYHAFTPGKLYLYTATSAFGLESVKGLIRGYEVDWTITIRPPGGEQTFECKLGSQPASQLKYKSESGDPDWAPNAILLYSDFFDMSSRLIRNFAIEPGPAPDSYTFAAATVNEGQ